MLVLVFRVPVLQNRIGALELSISSKSVPGRKSSHPNSGWCTRCKGILAAGIKEVCPTSPQGTRDSGTVNLKSTKLENLNTDGSKKRFDIARVWTWRETRHLSVFQGCRLRPLGHDVIPVFFKNRSVQLGRTTGCWSHRRTQELNDHRLGSYHPPFFRNLACVQWLMFIKGNLVGRKRARDNLERTPCDLRNSNRATVYNSF